MIRDAEALSEGDVVRARVCVVGGGAAGISLAMSLADKGHDVLLLESGSTEAEEATQALYEAEMTGEQWGPEGSPIPVVATRLRQLGGTTNHWAGYCRPLRRIDLEARPGLPGTGWDLSYDDLARWYPDAAEVLQLRRTSWDSDDWTEEELTPPLLGDDPEDSHETVVFQLSPVNFGATYRDHLTSSRRIDVLLHANVTRVRTDESGSRVTGLDVQTLGGRSATVEADVVVVAVGGIETPRLLLASNERGGLGNDRDLVGRNFCEHFQNTLGFAVVQVVPAELAAYQRITVPTEDGDALLQQVLVPRDDVLRQHHLLGHEVQLLARPFPGNDVPVTASGPSMADLAPFVPLGDAGSIVLAQVNAEQQVNPDSRITLEDRTDALGMPKAVVHWAHTERDRSSILEGLALLGRTLGRRRLGRLQIVPGSAHVGGPGAGRGILSRFVIDPALADPVHYHLAHGNHHMGTARLASDPARGVVDTDLRVHGLTNLFVAGSAVFPTPGVASPTITIVALTLRLADHLHRTVL